MARRTKSRPLVERGAEPIFQRMVKTESLRQPLGSQQRDILMIVILLALDGLVIYQHFRLQEAIDLLTTLAAQYAAAG